MLKPERMSKLTIIGPKTIMADVISRLYELKIYHIVDHKRSEELDICAPADTADDISEALVKARALCAGMGIDLAKSRININLVEREKLTQKRLSEIKGRIAKIGGSAEKNTEELKGMDEKLQKLGERKALFGKLDELGMDLESFSDYQSLSYAVGTIEGVKDIKKLKAELDRKTTRYSLRCSDFEGMSLIAIFFETGRKSGMMEVLAGKGFSEIDVSGVKGLKGSAEKQLQAVNAELVQLARQRKAVEKRINALAWDERDFLAETEKLLSIEAEKAEAPLRFGSTEKTFLIRGWVPSKKADSITKDIEHASQKKIYISSEPAKKDDEIPIRLKNPKIVQPFEFFMDMYTLPKYREIDPTFLMFLTFPLFYGFMLGDSGYGIVTLILFLFLRTKIKGDLGRLVNAMIFGSISSIIFGLLFGEFFGLEEMFGHELPHILSRATQVNELLYIAVAIGVVHINIGLLVGFYNELRAHGFLAAMFEKLSWIFFELSAAVIALSYMNYVISVLPASESYLGTQKIVGFVMLIISVMMIYKGEGAKGLVELPSIFSQTLSYARLMAVGLASVILAVVINDLAKELFHAGIGGIIGGIILLVVGHAINIALGLISPFLHSLRLHYVEFFTKFYQGGGMRYVPFGTRHEE